MVNLSLSKCDGKSIDREKNYDARFPPHRWSAIKKKEIQLGSHQRKLHDTKTGGSHISMLE